MALYPGSNTFPSNYTFPGGNPAVGDFTGPPSVTKISRIATKDLVTISWQANQPIQEYQIRSVPSSSSLQSEGTLIESGNGPYLADTPYAIEITDDEVVAADPGDETKVIKLFVRGPTGEWSS